VSVDKSLLYCFEDSLCSKLLYGTVHFTVRFTFPLHLFCATALPREIVEPENS